MAEYPNPRPISQPIGSTDLPVGQDNLITLDRLMNAGSGADITNRKGKKLTPVVDIIDGANSAINEAIGASFGVSLGAYPKTYTQYNQYTVYNGQQYGIKTPSQGGPSLPYTPTAPNPANDSNLKIYGDASQSFVLESVTTGQGELLGGHVFPAIGSLANGMVVTSNSTHLRVGGRIYEMKPIASGVVSSLTASAATIGGISVEFIPEVKKIEDFPGASINEKIQAANRYGGKVKYGIAEYVILPDTEITHSMVCEGFRKTIFVVDYNPMLSNNGFYFRWAGKGKDVGMTGGASLVIRGGNGGTAFRTEKQDYFTKQPKVIVKDLEIADYDGPDGTVPGLLTQFAWTTYLDIGNTLGCYFDNIYLYGNLDITQNPNGQLLSTGVKLQTIGASQAVLFPTFGSIWSNAIAYGIEINDRCFFFFDSVDITRSLIGVRSVGNNLYSECFFNKLAINAQIKGCEISNVTRWYVTDSFVNRHIDGWDGQIGRWFGYDFVSVQKCHISSVQAQPAKDFSNAAVGFRVKDSGTVFLNSVTAGDNVETCVELDNVASYQLQLNVATTVPNSIGLNMINNTRYGQATVVVPPSYSGTPFKYDATIDLRNQQILCPGVQQSSLMGNTQFVEHIDICDKDNVRDGNFFRFSNDSGGLRGQLVVDGVPVNVMLVDEIVGGTRTEFRSKSMRLPAIPSSSAGLSAKELFYDINGDGTGTLKIKL